MRKGWLAYLTKGMWQAGCLLVAAILCGFTFNFLNKYRLPIIASPPLTSKSDPRAIELILARQIFEEGSSLFIDARSPADYERGHIPGAMNIYAITFRTEGIEVVKDIPYEAMLIIYCDGEECELSQSLAGELELLGYQNIKILYAGWKGWKETETESQ